MHVLSEYLAKQQTEAGSFRMKKVETTNVCYAEVLATQANQCLPEPFVMMSVCDETASYIEVHLYIYVKMYLCTA